MVIFLTGLVAMILLRTLRNDYAKYTRDDDDIESLEHDISEESGWKLVHGDVFRPPPNLALLAALLGTGVQLALLVLFVILITIAGMLAPGLSSLCTLCHVIVPYVISMCLHGALGHLNVPSLCFRSSQLCLHCALGHLNVPSLCPKSSQCAFIMPQVISLCPRSS